MSERKEECYDDKCEEYAVVECKKCDGEFCFKDYLKNHPEGKCIHY